MIAGKTSLYIHYIFQFEYPNIIYVYTGLALDWLKNDLGINDNSDGLLNGNGIDKTDSQSESLNSGLFKKLTNNMEVQDPDEEGAVYFVPAFSGLYAPYWKEDARGYKLISFF